MYGKTNTCVKDLHIWMKNNTSMMTDIEEKSSWNVRNKDLICLQNTEESLRNRVGEAEGKNISSKKYLWKYLSKTQKKKKLKKKSKIVFKIYGILSNN